MIADFGLWEGDLINFISLWIGYSVIFLFAVAIAFVVAHYIWWNVVMPAHYSMVIFLAYKKHPSDECWTNEYSNSKLKLIRIWFATFKRPYYLVGVESSGKLFVANYRKAIPWYKIY